jgi:hypothetical protein
VLDQEDFLNLLAQDHETQAPKHPKILTGIKQVHLTLIEKGLQAKERKKYFAAAVI